MTAELTDRSRSGDDQAFAQLITPFRRELLVHCYRMLGSLTDAEDAMQETMLDAWRGLRGYEERASLRTWLYRIATNRCLMILRGARRVPAIEFPPPGFEVPAPTRLSEVLWLEPLPDDYLASLPAPAASDPAAVAEARETISLAFITALQSLPPRQRAVLILRDVLEFRASEVAALLETTEESVTSALKRARATMRAQAAAGPAPPAPGSPAEKELLDKLTAAFESGDIDGLIGLLTDDVLLSMPPVPGQYHGLTDALALLAALPFHVQRRGLRLIPTRANGQPASIVYREHDAMWTANGVLVYTLTAGPAGECKVSAITHFPHSVLRAFAVDDHLGSVAQDGDQPAL